MRKAFVYRLYPTPAQETALDGVLALCREVYNSMVNWRKHDFEVSGQSPNYYEQKKALPIWKQSHPELREIHSQTLQDVVKRVDLAFQAFFRRVKAAPKGYPSPGYPRMKGIGQYDSFTFTQGGYSVTENALTLFKIGVVKVVFYRAIEGEIKTLTIRKRSEKWFACFLCEVVVESLSESQESIGIDVGLSQFATLSDGSTLENPRFFRKEEKALAKAQRKLSRQKRGSSSRREARKVVSRIHERIRNRRHNFVHQFARRLVNRYGTIVVENLNVKGMVKNPGTLRVLAKSISDASWSMFRSVLTQKAESAVRRLVSVEPAYTSQDCRVPSGCCGYRVRKKLSERVHSCPNCGLVLDRDHNAALNIISLGLQRVSQSVEAAAFMRAE
ncbi:RNA-guided endonuclease InsQ/TnpB family protein [Armatimonas sp.]|uniref:RNA-guided endonuclease InsQ/TnpB family protein n=1 Tax=Armatimonas sp. TaxID=1872638 RepID=UPI0037508D49